MLKTGVSYYGCRIPKHVATDMQDIADHNCNYVLHCFNENDFQFYRSTMAEISKISKDKGLEVHYGPWGVGGIFGGESFSSQAIVAYETRQVLSNGRLGPGVCPNNPKTVTFLKEWIEAAVECGAEVIFWDEPHFYLYGWIGTDPDPDVWGCQCQYCRMKFQEYQGHEMPEELTDEIKAFKSRCLMEFLQIISTHVVKQGARNSVCLLPNEDAIAGGFARESAMLKNMESIGTDPYWWKHEPPVIDQYIAETFTNASKSLISAAKENGKRPHIWVQSFFLKSGWEHYVREALTLAYDLGARDLAVWSYWGAGYMTRIKSEDPDTVWATVGETYAELHERAKAEG